MSFIYKTSPSPHRKLKSSKSGMDISTGYPYRLGKSRPIVKPDSKSTIKPSRIKDMIHKYEKN